MRINRRNEWERPKPSSPNRLAVKAPVEVRSRTTSAVACDAEMARPQGSNDISHIGLVFLACKRSANEKMLARALMFCTVATFSAKKIMAAKNESNIGMLPIAKKMWGEHKDIRKHEKYW